MEALVGHDGGQKPGELLVVLLQLGVSAGLALFLGLVELRLDVVGGFVDDGRDLLAALLEGVERLAVLALHGLAALVDLLLEAVEVAAVVLGL